MANLSYPATKQAAVSGGANCDVIAGNLKVQLVDAGYAYSRAHDFFDDVAAGVRVGNPTLLTGKAWLADYIFDADDTTVDMTVGDPVAGFILFIDTGVEATSRLWMFFDTVTGLILEPNGVNPIIRWNAAGIVQM